MQSTSNAHKQYLALLKDEVLPKLTTLLHDLRAVKAKLEAVEKTSRKYIFQIIIFFNRQYQQKTEDVAKAKKKGIQSAVDQAEQALSIAESEHSKTMSGIMSMFEKYERNRLNILREIWIKCAESEKLLMTEVSDANFTVESCYLATNVEADITELIMELHKKKLQQKYIEQVKEAQAEEENDDEEINLKGNEDNYQGSAVGGESEAAQQPKARIPVEISDEDVKTLEYSKLNELTSQWNDTLTPCDLRHWNIKVNEMGVLSYLVLVMSYDYNIPDDKKEIFNLLANEYQVSSELNTIILEHSIDTHSLVTLKTLSEIIEKYPFSSFNNDNNNYRIWLRSYLLLLFTSLLWYIKQSEETIEVKSKQLLVIRKHAKEIQVLLSDEETDISWCLELLSPILEDCNEIISTFTIQLPIPVPVSNTLLENILYISLHSMELQSEFKQVVSLLDRFCTVIDVNEHFTFVSIFHSLLRTYCESHPRNNDIYMKIEEISKKIKEIGKDVVDPSVLDQPTCIYILLYILFYFSSCSSFIIIFFLFYYYNIYLYIVFCYPLSNDAYISITRHFIQTIVTDAINSLVTGLQSFYINYINDVKAISVDIQLFKLLYSIQQVFSDNADPLLDLETVTKESLLDTVNTGINNIFNSLGVDEETGGPLELSVVIGKVLKLIESPELNSLLQEMKEIKSDIDMYTYETLRTMTKDNVKTKCDELVSCETLNYEIFSLYHSTCLFDQKIDEILEKKVGIHETLSAYLNQWISNSFTIITKETEVSLKTEKWESEKSETDRFNPSQSSEKLILTLTTMLNSILSHLNGETLPSTCTKLFMKQVMDLLTKYCTTLLLNCDDMKGLIPPLPSPPTSSKSTGWGFKNLLGRQRRASEAVPIISYNIDHVCVRVNTLNYIKNQIKSIYDIIFQIISSDEDSTNEQNKSFDQFNNQFIEYETKILKFLGYYIIYVGLRSQVLESLYNPNFDTNNLEIILTNNMNILTYPFSVIEPVYFIHIRVNVLDAIINVLSRVLCCSGRATICASSIWEYTNKGSDTAEAYPTEIANKIEDALGKGLSTLKCSYNGDELVFDLCAMTVTNTHTDVVGTFQMKYTSKVQSDIEYIKQLFTGDADTNAVGGIDSNTVDVHLECIDSVLRYVHSSSIVLLHELEAAETESKEQILSILKHRVDDPVAIKTGK